MHDYSRTSIFACLATDSMDRDVLGLQSHQCDAIKAILVQNILSNRVQGLLTQQRVVDLSQWMSAYVLCVKHHYCVERAAWSCLRRHDGNLALLAKVDRVIGSIVTGPAARADLSGLAFISVKDKLARYPFDLPLSDWIKHRIESCVFQHYKAERLQSKLQVDFDDERPEVRRAACASDGTFWADRRIDLNRSFRMLSSRDRKILALKMSGVRIESIAEQVNLAPRTVYARMVHMAEHLLGESD